MSFKAALIKTWKGFNDVCHFLKPLGDLFIRYWVTKSFFLSGLTKVQSWSSTLLLFQYEYSVPLLPPVVAASLSAFIELGMSALLLLGLGGRVPALILFLFNIVAVFSYGFLWTQAGYVGFKDHVCWGLLLMILVLHGPGKLSLDYVIERYYARRQSA